MAGVWIKAKGRFLIFYYQTEEILLKKKIVGFWIVRSIDQIVNF